MSRKLHSLILAACISSGASAASFTITHFSTPPEAQEAIQYAAGIWGSILVSNVPIKVAVSWTPLGVSALGVTFPNGRKDFPGAPEAATWYVTALANSIVDLELNAGEDDINIYLNSGTNWYYSTDGNTPSGQFDLVSIALHELGHGLGFVGLAKKVGTIGSFGLLQASDFAPLITTFPWPQQDTLPGIFDHFLTSTANGPLSILENPGTVLGAALTSNQVYFNGPFAVEANGGSTARIFAPGTFALGSSCVHLNEATYPAGNANELMTPFSSAGDTNHWPGPICLGVMRDIGWTLAPLVGIARSPIDQRPLIRPNPVSTVLTVEIRQVGPDASFTINDLSGQVVRRVVGSASVDVRDLAAGTYLVVSRSQPPVRFVKF